MASNLPLGAEHDPYAPYNEIETQEREFDVKVEYTLSKSTKVESTDYYIEKSPDECYIDTTDVVWHKEYNNQHKSPLELIMLFKEHLEQKIKQTDSKYKQMQIQYLIDECSYWDEECNDIYEE